MNRQMSDRLPPGRREFLVGGAALGLSVLLAGQAWAVPGFYSRRISVSVRGTGPDVILIPGLGSAPSVWNGIMAAVPGYRYHLVQVKGFAGTAPEANGSGAILVPLTAEISRYISVSGLKGPAIAGHSMGGMLALMLGIHYPRSAGRLMVIDMLPAGAGMVGGTTSGMGALATQLGGYLTGTKGGRQMFRQLMGMFGPNAADNDPDTFAAALQDIANTDLTPDLPKIGVPLTVVYATPADAEQRKLVADRYRAAYAAVRDARLKPIGPSGHMVMFDQPQRFAAEMRAFLG